MKKEQDEDEQYWREKLNPEQYRVCRMGATEAPFSGKFYYNKEKGVYSCVACGAELFSSDTKFESGTGWPSFYDVMKSENVELKEDKSFVPRSSTLTKILQSKTSRPEGGQNPLRGGMRRIEVRCKACGSHLGHLFDDGPKPTGKRYCINSAALDFQAKK